VEAASWRYVVDLPGADTRRFRVSAFSASVGFSVLWSAFPSCGAKARHGIEKLVLVLPSTTVTDIVESGLGAGFGSNGLRYVTSDGLRHCEMSNVTVNGGALR